jgi:PatG C-terminal
MTDTETIGTATETAERPSEAAAVAPATESRVVPTQEEAAAPCPTCAGNGAITPPSYVYALGKIEPRFPSMSVEKEFAQATGRAETAGLTDRQALHGVLSERRNRYLVRKLCWVLTIEGLETYILHPHDPADWDLLVEALRPTPRPGDVDVVVGVRGPLAPPQMCNGLLVPIVLFSQIYSFDVDTLIKSIPRPEGMTEDQFTPAAEELFGRIMQMADNAGATDEHRALNYVATRYPAIYATTAEAHKRNGALTAVEVRPSRLSGVRRVVDVILSFTNRQTDVVEKYFVRVDVTEEFPFLVTKMSPYYDR